MRRYGRCIGISAATAKAESGMCHTTTSSIVSRSQSFVTEFLIGAISILLVRSATLRRATSGTKTAPILDAVVDRPVEDHLTYKTGETGVLRWPKSPRGTTTIEHADLNRDGWCGLPGTRGKIFLAAFEVIQKLKKDPDKSEAVVVRRELEEKKKTQYGSVIAFALEVVEL